jgi:hypothetical protein
MYSSIITLLINVKEKKITKLLFQFENKFFKLIFLFNNFNFKFKLLNVLVFSLVEAKHIK